MSNYCKYYAKSCVLPEPCIGIEREARKRTLNATGKEYLIMGEAITFLLSEEDLTG